MKLQCNKDILLNTLNTAIKAVSTRSTLAILEYFLIQVDKDGFKVIANDLELGIEVSNIPADIIEYGTIAIEAKILTEIIRKFNDDIVEISTDSENIATLTCGKSEFKLMGLSAEDFPYLPDVKKNSVYKINAINFKNMINQTIFSVGVDQSKPSMTGVLIELKNNYINLVTVDGFRVSHRKTLFKDDLEDFSLIVPPKTLKEITKIIPSDEELNISFYKTDNHILFKFNNITIVSRLIEGNFISYNEIFTSDFSTMLTLKRDEIIFAIERASLITSRDNKKNPIKLEIANKSLFITSDTETGNSKDEINVEIEGEHLEIAFNPRYLLESIKAIEEDEITMEFTTALSPCIIKPKNNENKNIDETRYLVLPLRLR
jgi:DNA polymerase III subunit beta